MRRGHAVAAIFGTVIAAAFGRVWLSTAADGLRGWRAVVDVAGWAVFGSLAASAVFVALRVLRAPPPSGGGRPRRGWAVWCGLVVLAEGALIGVGGNLLSGSLAHPEWIPTWTLFVVGAHFAPFAMIFRIGAFYRLAGAMCAAAVLSALVAGITGATPLWSILPGVSGAAALWGFTGWAQYRMARGLWFGPQPHGYPARGRSEGVADRQKT